ncbi:DUF6443 domain-containing protein [Aquimarina aggregata]|uniref:DUF6443 domain-containing protein n=1 Tax=Aquimarina aggregata TaxID=1642818 RepID=UPI0024937EDA|nr:DUF6443 domain-containing protein [Aquimarina aggregata]
MRKIAKYIAVALLFVGSIAQAQTPANIVKEGDYTITSTETLTATQSITLKPNSWIKEGSNFSAVVTPDAYIPISLNIDENYIFTRVYQEAKTTPNAISNNSDVIESISYFDGLGRPKQQIAIKASPDQKDIVNHITYDTFGRQAKQYLPFERQAGAVGSYNPVNINTDINSYYQNKYAADFAGVTPANVNAYSESNFESSPLNRVLEQGAPGTDWKANPNSDTDHTVKFDWATNTATEVFYFDINFTNDNPETPTLIKNGYYNADELLITITKDENWQPGQTHTNDHTTKEYTDKQGRVVLKRTYNNNVPHDTYYVYDDFGNLTYVIPPKVTLSATDGVSATELSELCYQYKYDYRNRLIEKKIPGKGMESIVYDNLDRPVLTQDANQAAKNPKEWLFTKYDALGRVIYTGIHKNNKNRAAIQSDHFTDKTALQNYETKVSTGSGYDNTYYSNDDFPNTNLEVLTVNYYDNYYFDKVTLALPSKSYGVDIVNYDDANTTQTRGLSTGSRVKVLTTNNWITTITGYDKKARPIYVASKNDFLNTTDVIESKLDFSGKVLQTKTTHTKDSNPAIVTIDSFTYDHVARLLTQNQQINSQTPESIVANTYDEIGQLASKEVGGGLQDVDYTYNVRGWLKSINQGTTANGDLFGFTLDYNNGSNALYNGNIAKTSWQTANDNVTRGYAYTYDALNRLKYGAFTGTNPGSAEYDMGVSYDKNGNIKDLYRFDAGGYSNVMDNLTYTYDSGNKLLSVSDTGFDRGFKDGNTSGNDFDYDINGNMTEDKNKGITSITYNHLNLPETVSISNAQGTGIISYFYDATGTKLKKIAPSGSSLIETEYAGNYVYKSGNLEFFGHSEGIVEKEADGYKYIYQYRDYLGNIRLSYSDTNNDGLIAQAEIIEEHNYYPFGLQHKGYNDIIRGKKHPYGFGGKEEQDELGIGWLDFHARNYDASIGRWMNVDPLADQFINQTPYNYANNNPKYFVDPDGMASQAIPSNIGTSTITDSPRGKREEEKPNGEKPNKFKQYFDTKLSQYQSITGVSASQSIGTSINVFFSKYSNSFNESFANAFSGIKTLFTNPLALLRVPSTREIVQNQIDNIPSGRLLSFGVKQQIAIMQGDPTALGAVHGAEFGRASIDLAGIAIGAGISRGISLPKFRILTDVGHKSLYTLNGNLTRQYFSGFQVNNFRFQFHKHWLPLKGVKPGTKVPHLNFDFGRGINYHFLLGKFRNNGSRFYRGGF